MKEFEVGCALLKSVLIENTSFRDALKIHFNNETNMSFVTGLVGCELRHHLLFSQLINSTQNDYGDDLFAIYLLLTNHFFFKRLDKDLVESYIKKYENDKKLIFFLTSEKSASEILNIPQNTINYISIRYNTPKWIIHMWEKHFGVNTTFKVLKSLSKPVEQVYQVNKLCYDKDEIITKLEFNADNQLFLINKDFKQRNEFLYKDKIIPTYKIFEESILRYHKDSDHEICVYSGTNDSFVKSLISSTNSNCGIHVVVPDISLRAGLVRFTRAFKTSNVYIFEANDKAGFDSGIANKQDVIFVLPKSSSFNSVIKHPDYLIHFKKESLDNLINEQKAKLELCSSYVAEGGFLVYIVDTLNKKESFNLIKEFLEKHCDFSLVDEKQTHVYDSNKSLHYVAVLRKKEND